MIAAVAPSAARESAVLLCAAAEACGELREQRRADADDDGQHEDFDPRRDDVAQHALGHEGSLAEETERDQHEAGERGQLELDKRHEKLDGEDEEGEQHQRPGEHQAGDLDEVLEERPVTHQIGDGVEQRAARVEAGLRHLAGPQKIRSGKAGARTFQAKTGETVEDDLGEIVPVADQVGEDTNEQRLLDQRKRSR